MTTRLYDRAGRLLTLGREVGRGGEGGVFEVGGAPDTLAKIYTTAPTAERVAKLSAMVAGSSDRLVKISAWPTDLLFEKSGSRPVGFLMPRVLDHRELHELYSPAHRKQEFPDADWAFLIHAARNLAAAVDTVHQEGHVIGDINQKGMLVSTGATVKLIDCDSFQIAANGRFFLCEVGVGDFTPPELQGQSFRGLTRTKNHDAFGLAVLCFQLLFMGRHPFSGRSAGPGDDSLEAAIRTYRFAYGASARSKGVQPPPNSLPVESFPADVLRLFERAFTEPGAQAGRPTAAEWIQVLDKLRGELTTCPRIRIHRYCASLPQCPWCALELAARVFFFISTPLPVKTPVPFDIDEAWGRIRAVKEPGPLNSPVLSPAAVPQPLSLEVLRARHLFQVRRAVGLAAGAVLLLATTYLGPVGFLMGVVLLGWGLAAELEDGGETERRQRVLRGATQRLQSAHSVFGTLSGERRFEQVVGRLESIRDEYRALSAQYQRSLQELVADMRASQERRYLRAQFLDRAKIDGIGPGRKSTLVSYGIETANDVTKEVVEAVPGFGPALTAKLLAWRAVVAASFHFDQSKGVDPQEKAALDQRIAQKQLALQADLQRGPMELESLRQQILRDREACLRELAAATAAHAQARADVSLL